MWDKNTSVGAGFAHFDRKWGCGIVLKLMAGCEKREPKTESRYGPNMENCNSNHVGSEWGGMAGLSPKKWQDVGLKKPMLDPL